MIDNGPQGIPDEIKAALEEISRKTNAKMEGQGTPLQPRQVEVGRSADWYSRMIALLQTDAGRQMAKNQFQEQQGKVVDDAQFETLLTQLIDSFKAKRAEVAKQKVKTSEYLVTRPSTPAEQPRDDEDPNMPAWLRGADKHGQQ